jgi:hypothetical protein
MKPYRRELGVRTGGFGERFHHQPLTRPLLEGGGLPQSAASRFGFRDFEARERGGRDRPGDKPHAALAGGNGLVPRAKKPLHGAGRVKQERKRRAGDADSEESAFATRADSGMLAVMLSLRAGSGV